MSVVVVTNAVLDGSDRLDLYGHYKGEDFHYSVDGREWVLRFAGGAPIVSALPRRTVPVGEPIRFLPDSGMNSRYFSWWHRLPDGTFLIYSPIKRTLARSLDVPRRWIKFCERLTDLRWLLSRAPRKEKQLLRQVRRKFVSEVLKESDPLPPPKRRIWLYFDKLYKGGDNGECQFRHACTKDDGIEHLYLVRRKTATYRQLVADGYKDKLLRPKSRAAIEAILRAEYVFLTHHPRWEYLG
ncbi:MAG: hypothetical protein LBR21_09690, partial [Propionibacteriaceae bacterium]|nr:hypothetical protein [Propionibacteriaceae bacterium]